MDIDKSCPFYRRPSLWIAGAVLAGFGGYWLAESELQWQWPVPGNGASHADASASLTGPGPTAKATISLAEALLNEQRVTLPTETGGQVSYTLALNEWYQQIPGQQGTQKIDPKPTATALLAAAGQEAARTGYWPGLVLYERNLEAKPEARRVLTSRLLIQLKNENDPTPELKALGLTLVSRPDYAPGFLIVSSSSGSPLEALKTLQKLQQDPRLSHVAPLLKRPVQAAAAPTPQDPLYPRQWHLENVGQVRGRAGFDIQVKETWVRYKGLGVKIAIVDDGLQIAHPDLAPNAFMDNGFVTITGQDLGISSTGTIRYPLTDFGYGTPIYTGFSVGELELINNLGVTPTAYDPGHVDWIGEDRNPAPDPSARDYHGTSVGGVAAARGDNNIGVTGVAPQATLIGHRFLGENILLDDEQVADIVSRGHRSIDIKNNSWGYANSYAGLADVGPLFKAAMRASALNGRNGRGGMSVWAAGNGRQYYWQGNKNGLANDMHSIAVGAVTNNGRLSPYSETGNHLAVVAPSSGGTQSIVTTDLTGTDGYNPDPKVPDIEDDYFSYTQTFGGTSSAAPVVSGVIALMLEANPELTWRDVKEIFLRSSRQMNPKSSTWVKRITPNRPDLPPIKHSPLYGGGLIQAEAAVEMARTWTPLGPQVSAERTISPKAGVNFENNEKKGIDTTSTFANIIRDPNPDDDRPKKPKPMRKVFDFSRIQPMSVEHVTLTLDLTHSYRGDLRINLISPSGVVSNLAKASLYDYGASYNDYTFSTLHHWGESPKGRWILEITDTEPEDNGVLNTAKLVIYGTAQNAATIANQTSPQILYEGEPLNLNVTSVITGEARRLWRKNGRVIPGQNQAALTPIPAAKLSDAGTYDQVFRTHYGDLFSRPIPVAVLRKTVPPSFKKEGETATFRADAAGPQLLYQWYKRGSGNPLVDNGRLTGTRTAQLTIRDIRPTDLGEYQCAVFFVITTGEQEVVYRLFTDYTTLGVQRRAVVQPGAFDIAGRVGVDIRLQLTADSSVTRYNVVGLPRGMIFDPRTGVISGAPAEPGHYTIYASATNALGTSEWTRFEWEVAPLPTAIVGSFQGLVDRHSGYTGGYGGSVTLVVTGLGTYSGTVTRGIHVQPITGRLQIADSSYSGRVMLPRRSPFAPLEFSFTLHPVTGALTGQLSDLSLSTPDLAAVRGERLITDATALVGRWNAHYAVPVPLVGNASYPQGSSWITQIVNADGTVSAALRLADGTAVTSSRGLSSQGQSPLHAMLYDSRGSVQGWQTFSSGDKTLAGQLSWVKSADTSRNYPAGFAFSSLSGLGALYTAPVAGTWLFGVTEDAALGRFVFMDGGLAQAFWQPFSLSTANVILMPAAGENPHQIQASLDVTTGIITGTGTAMDIDPENPGSNRQRPGSFSGLFIPTQAQVRGHFLLPTSAGTTAPILSGDFTAEKDVR